MIKQSIFKLDYKNTVSEEREREFNSHFNSFKERYKPEASDDEAKKFALSIIRNSRRRDAKARQLAIIVGEEFKKLGYSMHERTNDYHSYNRWTRKYGYITVLISWRYELKVHINHDKLWWNMHPKTISRLRTYLKEYFHILNDLQKTGCTLYGTQHPCKIISKNKTGSVKVKYLD